MAHRATTIILAATITLAAYQFTPTTAQTGCTAAIISLAPCLTYISGNSMIPSSSCCSQLATTVKSQPQCLCMVLNGGGSSIGISINKTRALALPGACKVQTPPVSRCNATSSGGPTSSPAKSPVVAPTSPVSPSPSSPVSPSSNPAPSTSPSNSPSIPAAGTAPSANGSKSKKGRSNKSAVLIMLSAVISASCFF